MTTDDCIGTAYLPISAISGQGDDGIVTDFLFFFLHFVTMSTTLFLSGMLSLEIQLELPKCFWSRKNKLPAGV